jgi:glycosyltransferase involved in cell wall biosynthesis
MIVLHLISSLLLGGKERMLVDLCSKGNNGSEKLLVIIINSCIDNRLLLDLKQSGIEVILLNRTPGQGVLEYCLKIRKNLKKYRVDVLHTHDDISLVFGIIGSIGLKVKKVHTCHSTITGGDGVALFARSFIGKVIERIVAKMAIDILIAVSYAVKMDYLGILKVPNSKIIVIYNGIELNRYSVCQFDPSAIVCIARLCHKVKGQDILIRALSVLQTRGIPFRCKFVGDGESRNYLLGLSSELGLEGQIEFSGYRNDIPEVLNNSGIIVLPSRSEGFGLAIIEGMASGKPVVAANIDGIREIIQDGENGLLFDSGDSYDLANKIEKVIKDTILRNKLINNALKSVLKYERQKMYDNHIMVYKKTITA